MKVYQAPTAEIKLPDATDIIRTSGDGTETTRTDENKGIWDFGQ